MFGGLLFDTGYSNAKSRQDPKLNGEYPLKAVAKLAAVASLYVQDEPDFRPNMSIVVRALQPLLKVAPAPVGTYG